MAAAAERLVGRLVVSGWAVRVGVALIIAVPFVGAVLVGAGEHSIAWMGGAIGASIAWALRLRPFLRLSRGERRRVWDAQRTARPCGESWLDAIAIRRLMSSRQNLTFDRIFAAIVLVALIVFAVFVGHRSSGWWAVALSPACAAAVLWATWRWTFDPRPRLPALIDADARAGRS